MSKDINQTEVIADATPAAEQIATLGEQLGIEPDAQTAFTETVEAILEPVTVDSAVRALVAALGHEEQFIKGIDINPQGRVRVLGIDNSARSVQFEPLERQKRNADGSIIS
ncbi:hypothetical protein MRBLMI12_000430 [Microbacterium sp. LMI12-1-1.1]|uniref:hypothetical protein n=1 Tax=Microbacterium sp. LMI12-1-1.1 TaxID=3135225 RepID=UPI0034369F1B